MVRRPTRIGRRTVTLCLVASILGLGFLWPRSIDVRGFSGDELTFARFAAHEILFQLAGLGKIMILKVGVGEVRRIREGAGAMPKCGRDPYKVVGEYEATVVAYVRPFGIRSVGYVVHCSGGGRIAPP